MHAIPSRPVAGKGEEITGVSCPDCPGVLGVSTENDHLRFRCRIGHVYSLQDLVEAKDRKSTRLNSSHVRISYAVF